MPLTTQKTTRYLYLQRTEEDRLHLLNEPTPIKYSGSNKPCRYRVSPIFPVLPSESVEPDLSKEFSVGFYFYDQAFFVINRLLNLLPKEYRKKIWFCHGLASIIVFASNFSKLDLIIKKYPDDLRAFEFWTIKNHVIVDKKYEIFDIPPTPTEIIKLIDFSELSFDIKAILFELEHCLNTAIERANRFIPAFVPTLNKIIEYINDIISDLLFLENPIRTPPQSLPINIKDIVLHNINEIQKRIHQRTGQLVQLNSQLSYVISQAFSGLPPILEHECQIRSYSLLGIGSAFLSIAGFANHVERVFERFPIDNVITDKYSIAPGVVLSANRLGLFNPDCWSSYEGLLDKYLKNIPAESFKPKLVSFSGRQGFRETETAITVALPVLSAADTARWSLMTLSHELMHGHVRALLGAIFSDSQGRSLTQAFIEYYKAFKATQSYNSPKLNRSEWKLPDSLIESLRFIIINYCCHREPIYEAGLQQNSIELIQPYFDNFRNIFAAFNREIHELLTHILDYNYFYDCQDDIYLNLLWSSWTPVPAVLENLERYILRSIITVASKETGLTTDRFNLSVRILKEVLIKLNKRRPENMVVHEAVKLLNDASILNNMLPEFTTGLYLGQMTKCFLISSQIYKELNEDPNRYLHGEYYKYRLKSGDFPGFKIKSPVAFIADRLRRIIQEESIELPTDHLSCWLLLSCASCYREGG